jgi:hypothetical protein
MKTSEIRLFYNERVKNGVGITEPMPETKVIEPVLKLRLKLDATFISFDCGYMSVSQGDLKGFLASPGRLVFDNPSIHINTHLDGPQKVYDFEHMLRLHRGIYNIFYHRAGSQIKKGANEEIKKLVFQYLSELGFMVEEANEYHYL